MGNGIGTLETGDEVLLRISRLGRKEKERKAKVSRRWLGPMGPCAFCS